MAKKIGIKKAFGGPPPWDKIDVYARRAITVRTEDGRNRDGERFDAYDKDYAKLKAGGHRTASGKKGKAFRGISTDAATLSGADLRAGKKSFTLKPNFRLRGLTMRSLRKLSQTRDKITIGWTGEAGMIVGAHEDNKKKNYYVGGITPAEHKEIINIVDKHFVSEWNKKTKNVTIEV